MVGTENRSAGGEADGPPRRPTALAAKPPLFLPRHPGDAVRLVAATAIFGLSAGLVNRYRVDALEVDVFRVVNDLPGALYPLVWAVMQFGNLLAVPVLAGVGALTRRYRLAVNLAMGGSGSYGLARLVKAVVDRGRPEQFLAGVHVHGPAATGLGYISGHAAVAFALASVASPYLGRRARRVVWVLAVGVCLSRLYVGAHLPLDLIGGAAAGWAVGAAVHLLLGAPSGSPTSRRIHRALVDSGFHPIEVRAYGRPDAADSTGFRATMADGARLFVKYIPRERRDADLAYRIWRWLVGRAVPGGSSSQRVEREAYVTLLAASAGVRVPRVMLARPTGNGAGLLVTEFVAGTSMAELPPEAIDDELLIELWRQVRLLHAHRIAHGDLAPRSVVVDKSHRPWLVDFHAGEAMAGAALLAADVIQLLGSLSRVVGREQARTGAEAGLGAEAGRCTT